MTKTFWRILKASSLLAIVCGVFLLSSMPLFFSSLPTDQAYVQAVTPSAPKAFALLGTFDSPIIVILTLGLLVGGGMGYLVSSSNLKK